MLRDCTRSLQDCHGDSDIAGTFGFSDADLDIEEYPVDQYTDADNAAMEAANAAWEAETAALQAAYERRQREAVPA